MTTYWVDPFLEATNQGNGTTDTSTRNGTYAAPFSITDIRSSTSSPLSSINGVSVTGGDEVRLKGLPFSTLFESHGNVYAHNSAYVENRNDLRPVTGNSSFDATISNTTSSLFAFQNSDVSSYLPNWSHPMFFAAYLYSISTNLDTPIGTFVYAVIDQQLGYNSASSTGIELFRLKDSYANVLQDGSTRYFYFSFASKIKLSAGWTSETAQEGYSILELFHTSSYKYLYINHSDSSQTQYDCERLVCCYAARSSAGWTNSVVCRIDYSDARYQATDHVAPMFANATSFTDRYYCDLWTGSTTVYPWICGNSSSITQSMSIRNGNSSNSRTVTFKNILIANWVYFYDNHYNCMTKLGNIYARANDQSGINRVFQHRTQLTSHRGGSYTFLQDSVYFLSADTTSYKTILEPDPAYLSYSGSSGTITYESGLKKPGIAPLDNLDYAPSNNYYGPIYAGSTPNQPLFLKTREVSTNNSWFDPLLSRNDDDVPIQYNSLAKLICNGNNFRTTAHNIPTIMSGAVGSATDAPKFYMWSAEHNDFDGKPISIISDPYEASRCIGVLLYNDVVSSVSVLAAQWSGTTDGASNYAWVPLDLSVPTYTPSSDNLRVTVSTAYADGASNSAAGSILLRAWHRDTTQSNNFRVYSSSATSISAGGDATSPTTVTLNLTNVPTSGQEKITSVILGIRLQYTSNTNLQKYYITNAAIETY